MQKKNKRRGESMKKSENSTKIVIKKKFDYCYLLFLFLDILFYFYFFLIKQRKLYFYYKVVEKKIKKWIFSFYINNNLRRDF